MQMDQDHGAAGADASASDRTSSVLIVGGGGFIGRHLAGRLMADRRRFVLVVRNAAALRDSLPGADIHELDLAHADADGWIEVLDRSRPDVIVNCVGIVGDDPARFEAVHHQGARRLFDAAASARVRRVVQISALGADDDAETVYHLTKRAADDHLASLKDLDWAIVRPSLVIGRGGDSTGLFSALASLPVTPSIGPGTWQVQPIHIDDLVEGIVRLIDAEGPIRRRIDAVGPEPMTTDGLTAVLRRWLGLPPTATLRIPERLLIHASRIGPYLGIGSLAPDTLSMLRRGNTAPPEGFVEACGFLPAPLHVALARTPSTPADVLGARLLPMATVLRLLLAFVWLCGGLVPMLLTPWETSASLLCRLGLGGSAAAAAMVAGSVVDVVIGLTLLLRRGVPAALACSVVVMTAYTLILTATSPHLWADPFGSLVKNAAVLGLTAAVWALETRRG